MCGSVPFRRWPFWNRKRGNDTCCFARGSRYCFDESRKTAGMESGVFVENDGQKTIPTLTIVHKCGKITMEYCAQTEKLCLRRRSPVSALR
jgi:hypothetical protein